MKEKNSKIETLVAELLEEVIDAHTRLCQAGNTYAAAYWEGGIHPYYVAAKTASYRAGWSSEKFKMECESVFDDKLKKYLKNQLASLTPKNKVPERKVA